MPGTTEPFGHYRLQRVLGEGASATVYLAEDLRDQRWVALKLLDTRDADAEALRADARARFLQEAEIVQRLQHPDIVTVHEVGETDGRLWLAMEPVPGCSLDRYLRGSRLLPLPVVVDIATRVAVALAHAHALGVVHRDIKPGNVLVDLAGGGVKIGDFGTARLLDSARTRTEVMLGTPAYMAPELLAGGTATAASDLYALGVLLFELVAGRRPHDSPSMGELLRQVASDPAPDLRTLRPALPPALARLVARLLAKRAAERPAGAAAVAAGLRSVRAALADGAASRATDAT